MEMIIEYYIYDENNIYKPPVKECIIFKIFYNHNKNILKITYSNKYTINNKQNIRDWAECKTVRKLTLPLLLSLNIIWGKKAQIYINEFLENEARRFTQ